jgi:arginyl-tRNA synthetase
MINQEIKLIIQGVLDRMFDKYKDINFEVECPKQKDNGDYSCNVAFALSKSLGEGPFEIAEKIVRELEKIENLNNRFSKVEAIKPGFINFYLADAVLFSNATEILNKKEKFGRSKTGEGKTVVVDYSAINIAKPMHVGHLRSTIIGQSLCNIYKALGYKVISDNHIGDWGTQFGKMIYAYKNWGDKKQVSKNPIEEMNKLYVRFHQEAQQKPELEEMARLETKKLQSGDDENSKLWKFFVRESLKDAEKIYKTLGVRFDLVLGESFYNEMLSGVVREALEKGVAKESEGAIIIDLDRFNLPPFLIRKTDGAYLYATTDLATAKYRTEKLKADKIFYVVSNEQALHFEQLFASLKLLGSADGVFVSHIKFGMILGENGKKFSTRKGDTVQLSDLISEAIEAAKKAVEEKNPGLSQKDKKKIARVVGLGAMKYNDLSQNRLTDISFDWKKMLSFEGNSAPYLQYSFARIHSLKEKYKSENKLDFLKIFERPDFKLLGEEIEKDILRQLVRYPEVIENAAQENSPHLIALYLFNLATSYNSFYNSCPIMKSEKNLARARLALSEAVAIVLKNGLGLLGIETVDKM